MKEIQSQLSLSLSIIPMKPNKTSAKAGGDKKAVTQKLEWNVKPKVGSLDNATHKAGKFVFPSTYKIIQVDLLTTANGIEQVSFIIMII